MSLSLFSYKIEIILVPPLSRSKNTYRGPHTKIGNSKILEECKPEMQCLHFCKALLKMVTITQQIAMQNEDVWLMWLKSSTNSITEIFSTGKGSQDLKFYILVIMPFLPEFQSFITISCHFKYGTKYYVLWEWMNKILSRLSVETPYCVKILNGSISSRYTCSRIFK